MDDLYDNLYEFWLKPDNERMWFAATPEDDKLICEKFGYLFGHTGTLVHSDARRMHLTRIILYDQISRHFVRHMKTIGGVELSPEWKKIALNSTEMILKYIGIENYNNREIPFVLLPLRHSCEKENIEKAKEIIVDLMEKRAGSDDFSYLRRFYQATVKQLSKMIKSMFFIHGDIGEERCEAVEAILDIDSIQEVKKPSLRLPENPICRELLSAIKELDKNKKEYLHLILSVSGGKDSMALATLLYVFLQREMIKCRVTCVHINYGNRDTSTAEEDLVADYVCNKLGFHLRTRRITELKRSRNSEERAFYEEITKEIRFQTYREVAEDDPDAYVILGHNHDDTIENIITNVTKKKHYDNLKGMSVLSEQYGVQLFRPLLHVTKADIEAYNKFSRTPFTYDSTPDWSDRGRLRDNVIPVLKEFNPATVDGLVVVSETLTEMDEIYQKYALPQILRDVIVNDADRQFEIPYNKIEPSVKVYRDIFDHFQIKQPSAKSMANLIGILKTTTQKRKVKLTHDLEVEVDVRWKCLCIPF